MVTFNHFETLEVKRPLLAFDDELYQVLKIDRVGLMSNRKKMQAVRHGSPLQLEHHSNPKSQLFDNWLRERITFDDEES